VAFVHDDAIREPASADETEDAIADGSPEHGLSARDDPAGDFEPRDVLRRTRRRRIAARPLREVRGIDRREVCLDQDLPAPGRRVGPLLEPDLVAVQHDRAHRADATRNERVG